MQVLVDTSVWSLAFRHSSAPDNPLIKELESLIKDFKVQLIGPIRQELLSGIKSNKQFEKLKNYLKAFPDYTIQTKDFELAAQYYNQCRSKGIQGSNTDFLICAISVNNKWPIFTTDKDFSHFQELVSIELYQPQM